MRVSKVLISVSVVAVLVSACKKDDSSPSAPPTKAPSSSGSESQDKSDPKSPANDRKNNPSTSMPSSSSPSASAHSSPSTESDAKPLDSYKNPRQITAGGDGGFGYKGAYICALGDSGVICWGTSDFGVLNIPKDLGVPSRIQAFGHTMCALVNDNVKCWGQNSDSRFYEAALRNPETVSVYQDWSGSQTACEISGAEVKCYRYFSMFPNGGWKEVKFWHKPTFANPKVVLSTGASMIVWDETGFHHFSLEEASGIESPVKRASNWPNYPQNYKDAKQISSAAGTFCVLYADSVKCATGSLASNSQENVPSLSNPRQVVATSTPVCAIDDNGVSCWGSFTTPEIMNIPSDLKKK